VPVADPVAPPVSPVSGSINLATLNRGESFAVKYVITAEVFALEHGTSHINNFGIVGQVSPASVSMVPEPTTMLFLATSLPGLLVHKLQTFIKPFA
jgi:hypothetical protein